MRKEGSDLLTPEGMFESSNLQFDFVVQQRPLDQSGCMTTFYCIWYTALVMGRIIIIFGTTYQHKVHLLIVFPLGGKHLLYMYLECCGISNGVPNGISTHCQAKTFTMQLHFRGSIELMKWQQKVSH